MHARLLSSEDECVTCRGETCRCRALSAAALGVIVMPHESMATSNLQDCKLTKLAMVMFLFALPSAQITYKMRVPDCTSLIACMDTAICMHTSKSSAHLRHFWLLA